MNGDAGHARTEELERPDALPEGRRREVLRHAEACATCRASLTRADPTAVFSLLALTEIPEFSLARLSRGIDAAIDADTAARPPAARGWRPDWRAAASIAAALVLAALFALSSPSSPTPPTSPSAARLEAARVARYDRADNAPERGLELISSPGEAEVVDLSVGDTQVVMIFDRALDI